ncbi:M23 family metallopeptidase [Candidatus Woesearchaeota archaeon]|nr:M23 family metallopeptidase [Candidatus Woesearchaeota archaeon]
MTKKDLEKKVRRIVPWYEEVLVGTIKNIPYGIGAAAAAGAAEQWTAAQSFAADAAVAIPVAATLVTLEALAERFTEEYEPLGDKIKKGIIAGAAAASVCGLTYTSAVLATVDAEQAAYAVGGAVAGYVGLKLVKLAKFSRAANLALAGGAFSFQSIAGYDFNTDEESKQNAEEAAPINSEEFVEHVRIPPSQKAEKVFISYTAVPPFTRSPLSVSDIEVSSCFGYRGNGVAHGKGTVHHPGIDVHAKFGSPVYAVGNGIVAEVDAKKWGRVRVYHGNDLSTNYLHMDTIYVHEGEKVAAGETILGLVGRRGPEGRKQYDPHLHFEVSNENISPRIRREVEADALMSGSRVNPLCYLDTNLLDSIRANRGCLSEGGWDKFCTDYVGFTESDAELAITKRKLLKIGEDYDAQLSAAVQGTMVSSVLLTVMSGVESMGKADAGIGTAAVGILQFEGQTAYGYGLCDKKGNKQYCVSKDDRPDAGKELRAGAVYLDVLTRRYLEYAPDEDTFAIAAYNAGEGIIDAAIRQTEKEGLTDGDVTWEEVADRITPRLVCKVKHKLFTSKNLARCHNVAERVKGYVVDVLRYQAILLDQPFENKKSLVK